MTTWLGEILDSRRSALAALTVIERGDPVLVFGGSGLPLGPALAHLGADVTAADQVYARARLAQLLYGESLEACVHLDLHQRLPWGAGTFSAVFVDLTELTDSGMAATAIRDLLREVRRVLRPTGTAVVATRNPLSVLRSSRHDRALRHVVRDAVGLGVRGAISPWRHVLRGTELRAGAVHIPVPSLRDCEALVPASSTHRSRGPRWRRLAARWLSHDYVLTAAPASSGRSLPTLGSSLLGRPTTVIARHDERLAIDSTNGFLKVPLTRELDADVTREVERTRAAAATGPFGPHVLGGAELLSWQGVPVGRYPHLDGEAVSADEFERSVLPILDRADAGLVGTVGSTELYERLRHPRFPENLTVAPFASLRAAALAMGALRAPLGASHGDLHPANAMMSPGRGLVLIDWANGASRNPLVIDALSAAVHCHAERNGVTRAQALAEFCRRSLTGPLAVLAESRLGELNPTQAAVLLVLGEASFRHWSFADLPADGDLAEAAYMLGEHLFTDV